MGNRTEVSFVSDKEVWANEGVTLAFKMNRIN